MSRSIAGATIIGHLAERYDVRRRLSATPVAILAIVFADAGAMMYKSAQIPRETWLFQSPFSGL